MWDNYYLCSFYFIVYREKVKKRKVLLSFYIIFVGDLLICCCYSYDECILIFDRIIYKFFVYDVIKVFKI